MKLRTLSMRTVKEIVRDPLTLAFGLGFPVVLLVLLSAIQANIPVELFAIAHLTPGITVFGLAFMTLFSATLIAKDRESALLDRLYTAPVGPATFLFSYTLPLVPIGLAQAILCYLLAFAFGLAPSLSLLLALACLIPVSLFFIAAGLLFGSILNVKQVGGICGALFTNLTAWLSGVWFDLDLVGNVFKTIAASLPFYHAVELERAAVAGDLASIPVHLFWVLGYTVATFIAAVLLFLKQMKK